LFDANKENNKLTCTDSVQLNVENATNKEKSAIVGAIAVVSGKVKFKLLKVKLNLCPKLSRF